MPEETIADGAASRTIDLALRVALDVSRAEARQISDQLAKLHAEIAERDAEVIAFGRLQARLVAA